MARSAEVLSCLKDSRTMVAVTRPIGTMNQTAEDVASPKPLSLSLPDL